MEKHCKFTQLQSASHEIRVRYKGTELPHWRSPAAAPSPSAQSGDAQSGQDREEQRDGMAATSACPLETKGTSPLNAKRV